MFIVIVLLIMICKIDIVAAKYTLSPQNHSTFEVLFSTGIRRLQLSLLKIALTVGVTVYTDVEFKGLKYPDKAGGMYMF